MYVGPGAPSWEEEAGRFRTQQRPGRTVIHHVEAPAMTELYEIAYDEAKDLVKAQSARLDDQRTRATQFASLAVAGTSLLAAFGAKSALRDSVFYVMAISATISSLIMLTSLVFLLLPGRSRGLTTSVSGSLLVDEWIEAEAPPTDKAQFLKTLTAVLGRLATDNHTRLAFTQRLYALTVVSGSIGIVLWSAVVWTRS